MSYTGQSKIAFDAGFNDALFGRDRDNPYTAHAKSYAAYEEGYDEGLISDVPPRGPRGYTGDKGDKGDTGNPGADGADGNDILTGAGAPSAGLGNDGDVYIDGTNGDIYTKAAGVWSLTGSANEVALTTRTDTDGGSPETIYKGTANPGTATSAAAWRMERITIATDGDVSILYADGNDNFDNIWDNRASLSYS